MMSDVSFARAGPIGKAFFIATMLVLGAVQRLPKITTKQRWAELTDKEMSYDLAVAKLAENARLRCAMQEACDLLAERTQGSPARSAGHNARLVLEAELGEQDEV